jgi:hypothetical protein
VSRTQVTQATGRGSGGFKSGPGSAFGTLEQVFDDVWWAWGTVRMGPGIEFPRNMVIVRERGELVVIHPVMMPPDEQAKVEALGPIRHIVRLGAFHGMDDPAYIARYKPTTWAPPGVDLRDGATRDRELVVGGETPIAGAQLDAFEASQTPEMVLFVPRHGGFLVSCDSIQNWDDADGVSLLARPMMALMGFRGRACLGPGWRKQCEPKDGVGFGPTYRRLLALEFRHVLSAHGKPMKDTAREELRASVAKHYPSPK